MFRTGLDRIPHQFSLVDQTKQTASFWTSTYIVRFHRTCYKLIPDMDRIRWFPYVICLRKDWIGWWSKWAVGLSPNYITNANNIMFTTTPRILLWISTRDRMLNVSYGIEWHTWGKKKGFPYADEAHTFSSLPSNPSQPSLSLCEFRIDALGPTFCRDHDIKENLMAGGEMAEMGKGLGGKGKESEKFLVGTFLFNCLFCIEEIENKKFMIISSEN